MSLIVVESPTKARTFNRILKTKDWGENYFVFATVGHFRDLPADKMGVDIKHNFQPSYTILEKKMAMVEKLKELAKEHKDIILATDADREGESISFHVASILGLTEEKWPDINLAKGKNLKRIVFHEITPSALEEALNNPENLRLDLVQAQQARRILDRVVGYQMSPLLWKKMGKNWLSAGRVQSVALRLIVEREKEILAFGKEPYFQIYGFFGNEGTLKARLIKENGKSIDESTKIQLFEGDYEFSKTIINKEKAAEIENNLKSDIFTIERLNKSTVAKYPPPPFTTSLLQQEAFRRLSFPSKLTMRIAQSLYEKGLITYHRTDSFNLSAKYVFPAKDYIINSYGKKYALEKPRGFRTKTKNAQEAHEAIRPTKADRPLKDITNKKLSLQEKKLYELIFNRALATQMKEAEIIESKIYIKSSKNYEFEAIHQQVIFDGYLRVSNPQFAKNNTMPLYQYEESSRIELNKIETESKETRPPNRYSEASIIKTLEEKGIGRPSTYSSIITLIIDKHYVEKDSRYLKPTVLGSSISDYLSLAFPQVLNLTFTAKMEDDLDEIAGGKKKVIEVLNDFYAPFEESLKKSTNDDTKIDVAEDKLEEPCPKCGSDLVARYGKYGKFYACKSYPTCKYIKPNLRFIDGYSCPQCGKRIVMRFSKAGRKFYGCEGYPDCKHLSWVLGPKNTETNSQSVKK